MADENFNNQIVRGVLRQSRNVDILRIQDVNLSGANDPTVLELLIIVIYPLLLLYLYSMTRGRSNAV